MIVFALWTKLSVHDSHKEIDESKEGEDCRNYVEAEKLEAHELQLVFLLDQRILVPLAKSLKHASVLLCSMLITDITST